MMALVAAQVAPTPNITALCNRAWADYRKSDDPRLNLKRDQYVRECRIAHTCWFIKWPAYAEANQEGIRMYYWPEWSRFMDRCTQEAKGRAK
jgi:hypothetical protein